MYHSINLILYSEKGTLISPDICSIITEQNVPFKQLNSLPLVFHAIKNPQNYIIVLARTKEFLNMIENISKECHNYQNRIFIIYSHNELIDYFFENYCTIDNLSKLKVFINSISLSLNILPSNNTSSLLYKLIHFELEKLGLSNKYIGFKYLINVLTNALGSNFYCNEYINLFECASRTYSTPIDTIERDIRHMLLSNWKNNLKFKENLLKTNHQIQKLNGKTLINAIITYLKNTI